MKGLAHFQARFKEKAITVDAVMKMNGEGEVAVVMVLSKKEKKDNAFYPITGSQERSPYMRNSIGVRTDGREKYTDGAGGRESFLLLEETSCFITHKALLRGPTGR